jgi:hypothetical protein
LHDAAAVPSLSSPVGIGRAARA